MPTGIVTETSPMPGCNLTEQDVGYLMDEMRAYVKMFEPAYVRREQLEWSQRYIYGLLGDASRKNIKRMALELGENVRSIQHFMGHSPWEQDPVIVIYQRLVGEMLGEANGVALIDETSVVKQGAESVGVATQYCGSVGKIANGQVEVYLGYASRKGYSLIEPRLFMPGEWFDEAHVERCSAGAVPDDLAYQSKPEIGLKLWQKAAQRGSLPFQ